MPRASGARTGQKLKKRKLNAPTAEVSASEPPVLAALEAAVATHLSSRQGGDWIDLPITGAEREERFPFA